MKLIKNTGSDRVIDELRQALASESALALASPAFSLFAFAELREALEKLDGCRVVLLEANGSENDRAFRNRLQVRWLARECAAWTKKKVELRSAPALLPQSILVVGKPESELQCAFTPCGTHAMKGEFQGINDFVVVAFLVVFPDGNGESVS